MSSTPSPDTDPLVAHAEFVRAVAQAALRGDDAVEDVVQDTYVAALSSGPRQPGALRAWLAGVVRRQAAARIRKRGMRRRHAPAVARDATDGPTLDLAVRVETARQVVDAVLSLDEPYRTAVLMRYWDDLPPRDIARAKNVPVETARTWVKRGLAQLRGRLERDHRSDRGGWRAALLPLAAWPVPGAGVPIAGLIGGALVGKKIASVVIALLLIAAGAWWWSRPGRDADRSLPDAPPVAVEPPPGDVLPRPPSLAGRPGAAEEGEAARSADEDAPFRGRVVDPGGTPMQGVKVEATVWWRQRASGHWSLHPAVRDAGRTALLEVTTDEGGRFALPRTPDGSVDNTENACVAVDVIVAVDGYVRAGVRLELDDETEIRLQPGGTLVVRVVDADGDLVPGARVSVRGTSPTGYEALGFVAADAKGFQAVDGRGETLLPAGSFLVQARHPEWAPSAPEKVAVEAGGQTEQVLRLQKGLVVRVRLMGPDDEPVSRAGVRLAGPARTTALLVSDADGRCQATGIAPPGKTGRFWQTVVFYRVHPSGYALCSGYKRLPRGEATFDLDLRLDRGVPVSVRVVDDAGAPIEKAEVALELDRNGASSIPPRLPARRLDSGWFGLPRLSPGTYRLLVTVPEDGYHVEPVDLVVGSERVERVIVLARRQARLRGRVLLPDGSPAPGSRVGVVDADGERFDRLLGGREGIAEDGSFALSNVKGGPQLLVAYVPGYLPQWREIDVAPGEANPDVVFRLERRGRVLARVQSWDDEPIAGAEVELVVRTIHDGSRGVSGLPMTTSDAEGYFEILGLDEHPIELRVRCDGWERAWPWPETLRAGDDEALFVMKPKSEGAGMVLLARVTAGGRPYEGKLGGRVEDPGGGNPIGLSSSHQGEGLFECRVHLRPPGRYDLRFHAKGWQTFEVPGVRIGHRPPHAEVDVSLVQGAVLELRVVDGDGRPLANHWLRWRMGDIQTDESGRIELTGLDPGELRWLHLQDPRDATFTYAWFESVPVPGTLQVVMQRCARVVVRTPLAYADLTDDVVFRLLDGAGGTVDEYTVRVQKVRDRRGMASWALKASTDGAYRVVVETAGRRAEAEVSARVGHEVALELDPR